MYRETAQNSLITARRYKDLNLSLDGLQSSVKVYTGFLERARKERDKLKTKRSEVRGKIRSLERYGGTEITELDDGRKRMKLRSRERNINNLRAKETYLTRQLVPVRDEEAYCRQRIKDLNLRIENLYDSKPTSI